MALQTNSIIDITKSLLSHTAFVNDQYQKYIYATTHFKPMYPKKHPVM